MSDNAKKIIGYVIAVLIVLAIGFFVGRSTIKTKTVKWVKYVKGDPIEVVKDSLVPVYVNRPIDTLNVLLAAIQSGDFDDVFPVRDSIIYVTKEDSSEVILDWATERIYEEKLFDIDTVGTETVKMRVQYNRLQEISSTFVPVVKNIGEKEIIVKKYSPFVGGGITTMPAVVANAGMFFEDKYGVSLMYEYNWEIKKHAVGVTALYKF